MTWLSEIEAHSKKFRDDFITPEQEAGGLQYIDEMDNELMARVLRELVACLKAIEAGRPIDKAIEALPDDAKELLNE